MCHFIFFDGRVYGYMWWKAVKGKTYLKQPSRTAMGFSALNYLPPCFYEFIDKGLYTMDEIRGMLENYEFEIKES